MTNFQPQREMTEHRGGAYPIWPNKSLSVDRGWNFGFPYAGLGAEIFSRSMTELAVESGMLLLNATATGCPGVGWERHRESILESDMVG